MDSPHEAAKLLGELREFGAKIYLDDFGCGYSSLSHLHKLPVDALKIDRSFVKSLLLPDRPAIVESILALARTLKTSVVAEGIEDDMQARELERLGCTHAQGYLFSRPLSTVAVEEMLLANRPLGPKEDRARELAAAMGNESELSYFVQADRLWPRANRPRCRSGSARGGRRPLTFEGIRLHLFACARVPLWFNHEHAKPSLDCHRLLADRACSPKPSG